MLDLAQINIILHGCAIPNLFPNDILSFLKDFYIPNHLVLLQFPTSDYKNKERNYRKLSSRTLAIVFLLCQLRRLYLTIQQLTIKIYNIMKTSNITFSLRIPTFILYLLIIHHHISNKHQISLWYFHKYGYALYLHTHILDIVYV